MWGSNYSTTNSTPWTITIPSLSQTTTTNGLYGNGPYITGQTIRLRNQQATISNAIWVQRQSREIEELREANQRRRATIDLWATIQVAEKPYKREEPRYRTPKGPTRTWRRFSMLSRLPSLHCGRG